VDTKRTGIALFCGTLRENIAFGCSLPTPDEATADDNEGDVVERAARLANADSFIRQFPDGCETEIENTTVQFLVAIGYSRCYAMITAS
jgi:ABC-type multidrug transport system fused ATPase/permease subunit